MKTETTSTEVTKTTKKVEKPTLRKKNTFYFKVMKSLFRIISEKQTVTYAQKPEEGEVAIFASNHAGAIGPISMELNFDRPYRPWVIRYLVNFKTCKEFAFYEFLNAEDKKPRWFFRFLAGLGATLLCPLIRGYSAIRVFHGAKVMQTFQDTIETLDEGKNIVIFPENNEYYSDYIFELNKGFVDIGKMYYAHCGKVLKFYPCYIAPGLHTIQVGKPIAYDPNQNYKQQRITITNYLRDTIYDIATSLPAHKPASFTGEDWNIAHEKYMDNIKEYLDIFERIDV